MSRRTVKLLDQQGRLIAVGSVSDQGNRYAGFVDIEPMPSEVQTLFEEFEGAVNGQLLGHIDDLVARIAALRVRAVFDDGTESRVRNLQIFPADDVVSFELTGTQIAAIASGAVRVKT